MLTGHTLNDRGVFEETSAGPGVNRLQVQTATSHKAELMLYVRYEGFSENSEARIRLAMSDPDVLNGVPFTMSQLSGGEVVPMELKIVQSGQYRIPIPAGVNEHRILVDVHLDGNDSGEDSLSFWLSANAYQAVSGLIT